MLRARIRSRASLTVDTSVNLCYERHMTRIKWATCSILAANLLGSTAAFADSIDDPSSAPPVEVTDNMYPTVNLNHTCYGSNSAEDGLFCQTDGIAVSFTIQTSVTSGSSAGIRSSLTNNFGATQLTISEHSTAQQHTDIVYQQGNMPIITGGVVLGITWCKVASNSTKCDKQYVRFLNTITVAQKLACHETGHAVGLTHGNDAYPRWSTTDARLHCMVTPYNYADDLLGPMNIAEINATY